MEKKPSVEVLTVSQLSAAIKQHLEMRFFSISVQGEISNLKEQSSGHFYFTLKDKDAQIAAVLFKGNARLVSKLPKNGDQVIVQGELNVYPPRGYYQIIVREMKAAGVGELLLKLHEMKIKLQERGWFDKARRKPLPKYPKTIGVVTSPTGSVIQDILHILTRRLSGFHLILNPVKVQGEQASQEIAAAIAQFNQFKLADVLIIGRGGGSLEDLWAFNEENVASAIFHSQIPIICAVGHETDYCIADFVADVRAPTPSAAAELVSAETSQQLHFLSQAKQRLTHTLRTQTHLLKKQLDHFKRHPHLSSPYHLLAPHLQRLDDLMDDCNSAIRQQLDAKKNSLSLLSTKIKALNPKNQLLLAKNKLHALERASLMCIQQQLATKRAASDATIWMKKIDHLLCKYLLEKREKLTHLIAHLASIDPKGLLAKGYCLLFREKIILSAKDLQPKDQVHILLHDGKAELTVEKVLV